MATNLTEAAEAIAAEHAAEPVHNTLNTDTVAIAKSAGRVRWQVPVFKADEELKRAPDLEEVVSDLIEHYPNVKHLTDSHIRVYWKKTGRTRRGQPNIGGISRPSPWYSVHADAPPADYLFWLAADHVGDQNWTGFQVEAFLYRLLCSLQQTDEGEIKEVAPDFAGYIPEIEAYGLWHGTLKLAAPAFHQLALPE